MPQELDFSDLSPQEVRVKNLLGKNYVLREQTVDVATRVENWRYENTTFDEKGRVTGTKNFADSKPMTVGLSLFEEGANEPVGHEFVKKLPNQWQVKLHAAMVAMSPDMEPKATTKLDLDREIERLQAERAKVDAPKDVPGGGPGSTPSPSA